MSLSADELRCRSIDSGKVDSMKRILARYIEKCNGIADFRDENIPAGITRCSADR